MRLGRSGGSRSTKNTGLRDGRVSLLGFDVKRILMEV